MSASTVRAATEAEAIFDLRPSAVYDATSTAEVADIVRETASDDAAIVALGSGTQRRLGNPLRRYDVAVRMRAMRRVVDYAPEDQVITVEAGMTLGELATVLAASGQRLPLDPCGASDMTVGGIIATGDYGPRAARYGTVRDMLIGIEFVRADGTIAHGGGKVVKNVAGFDLCKAVCGSLGTLGIITRATFRVRPLAANMQGIGGRVDQLEAAVEIAQMMKAGQLEPATMRASTDRDGCDWNIAFEGFEAGVATQIAHIEKAIPACAPLCDDATRADMRGYNEIAWRVRVPPGSVCSVDRELRALATHGTADWDPLAGALVAGAAFADAPPDDVMVRMRAVAQAAGGTLVVLRSAPDGTTIDAWGTPPPSLAIMRALKDRFDPTGRLNPGRFIGGI